VGAYLSADAGTVLAFLSYFTIILNAMLGLSKIFIVVSRGVASADRVEEVLALDEKERIYQLPEGDGQYAVQFTGVNFSYNGKENNLTDINFELKEGQTLGIIGATGSGKSTIINLLTRFYEADSGNIYVFGKEVRSVDTEKLRRSFGYVFQNDFLMAASVRENIDYGRGLSDEDIWRAINHAQAGEFVENLDGKLDFVLSQKAANLSGGQKQRLLIARALAGNPKILILDDCSSALDYATDAKLRKELKENYPDTTKIIIAQRISSIMGANEILVMDDGKIIGKGTHDNLLLDCEEYKNIYEAQMGTM
jgi:ATP-binding cassette subfamily B protein